MAAPVNSILEVSIVSKLYFQTILNVLHYRVITVSGVPNTLDEQDAFNVDFANVALGGVMDKYKKATMGLQEVVEIRSQFVSPLRFRASKLAVSITGLRGNNDAANQAVVITKRGQFANRRNIGSIHIPAPGEGDIDAGVLAPAYKPILEDLAAELEQNITVTTGAGVYEPVIYSRGPAPDNWQSIDDCLVQDTARVMRRRTVGLGI